MRNRLEDTTKKRHIFGLGLDNQDGHKRMTTAEQFSIIGGSEETHERMTGTMMKTFEELKSKGKALEETEPKELADIISKSSQSL